MDIEVLKEFVVLAEELNFTTSATRCHLSQPTFSRHIQALEKEVGRPLFTRNKNLVELTPEGKAFLPGAEKVIYDFDSAIATMKNASEKANHTLNVAYMSATLDDRLDEIYAKHLERSPHVKLNLMSSWESRLALLLDKGKADLIITMAFEDADPALWSHLKMGEDSYSVIVPKGHSLYDKKQASLHQLGDHETVLIPSRRDFPFQYEHLRNMLDKKTRGVKIKDSLNDKHDISALCNAGHGVSLVRNKLLPHIDLGDAHAIPLTDEELKHDICAIWRKDTDNDAVLDFVEILKEH